jgi:putative membrane protein
MAPPSSIASYWLLQTLAMIITAAIIPGLKVKSAVGALWAVLFIAFVNATIWDAALFFALPDSFAIHSMVLLISNGILFWAAVKVLPGIEIEGIIPALLAPVVFTICSVIVSHYGHVINWEDFFKKAYALIYQLKNWLTQRA